MPYRISLQAALCPCRTILLAATLCTATQVQARQPESTATPAGAADSLQSAYFRELATLSSPQLEERKTRRRALQRQGYTEVLHEVIAGDGLAALMSWLRLTLQLEYSIARYPLFAYARGPETRRDTTLSGLLLPASRGLVKLPLVDDRSFPINPWAPVAKGREP